MTPLEELLAERIRRYGPIPFADFMRECLYHPVHGYYSKAESQRFADYYTSVDVHPVFGRLLAREFAEMWEQLGRPEEFLLVEAGAGVGRLATHILDFCAANLPELYLAVRYVAVEQSASRREQANSRLRGHAEAGHLRTSPEIPAQVPAGCVFSNELMDALAVHRVVMEKGALQEIFVACENGNFVAAGLFDERHMRGTLLAYREHRVSEDFYASPGAQDLTAHVNFTALETWGERSGLETAEFTSQTAFLLALGQGNEFADLYDAGQSETEQVRARLQLKTLIHPEGMGERFQVLVQRKGSGQKF